MLVENQTLRNRYLADGIVKEFPYTFPILEPTHVKVMKEVDVVDPVTGAITKTSEAIDKSLYTVTGAGKEEGGSVNFTTAPVASTVLSIIRDVPFTQLYKYTELDNFPAASHENALAKHTMMCLQLLEMLSRAVIFPETSDTDPKDFLREWYEMFEAVKVIDEKLTIALQNIFTQTIKSFTTQDGVLEYELGTDYVDSNSNNLLLVMDHVVQEPDVEYTIISPNKIKFTSNPGAGKQVWGVSSLPFSNPDIRAIIEKGIADIQAEAVTQIALVTQAGTAQVALVVQTGTEQTALVTAEGTKWSGLARAWAESDTPPDPSDPDSKSAKSWALIASDNVPLASKAIAGKVQIGSNIDVTLEGVISVKDGTTAQKGAVQLTSTVDNDETKAVTPKALNEIKEVVDGIFAGGIFKPGDFKISYKNAIEGYLLCDGSYVSRTTYVDLFAVIGTTFGAGDGSTTFNLPDLRGRFIQGANNDLGSVKEAGLPNITGQFGRVNQLPGSNASGCFTLIPISSGGGYTLLTATSDFSFSAQKSNAIYGKSPTVQPPAVALNVFIKY